MELTTLILIILIFLLIHAAKTFRTRSGSGMPLAADSKEDKSLSNRKKQEMLSEAIRQPLYDRQMFEAKTAQTLIFFRGKSRGDFHSTNVLTNTMPDRTFFDIKGISAIIHPAMEGKISRKERQILNSECYFEFVLDGKIYVRIPFHMLPHNGNPGLYPVDIDGSPIRIMAQQEFRATLTTTNTVAFSTPLNVWLYLHGVQYRPLVF